MRSLCRVVLVCCALIGGFITYPGRQHVKAATTRKPLNIIGLAYALIGSPYAYIGDDPHTGFSCIGFAHYIYGRFGINVPYDLKLAYAASPHVNAHKLQPGDLVFFSNTVWKGLSHVAIYAGNDYIIGADNFKTGVEMTRLSDPYWRHHYSGATRPLGTKNIALPVLSHLPQPHAQLWKTVRIGSLITNKMASDIYSGPGYVYQRIDHLSAQVKLRVIHTQQSWVNVSYGGAGTDNYGWISSVDINP